MNDCTCICSSYPYILQVVEQNRTYTRIIVLAATEKDTVNTFLLYFYSSQYFPLGKLQN